MELKRITAFTDAWKDLILEELSDGQLDALNILLGIGINEINREIKRRMKYREKR